MVAGVIGDAFAPDSNSDGIPDGDQLDADQDGTADGKDPDADDPTATFPLGPQPRYAVFPITNAAPFASWPTPIQINDRGTVLYCNGTWTGGTWTPLTGALNRGDVGVTVLAARINDNGKIIGIRSGWLDENGEPESTTTPGNLVHWPDADSAGIRLAVGGDYPWIGGIQLTYPGNPGIQFSKGGQILARQQKFVSNGNALELDAGFFLWTIAGTGRAGGKSPVSVTEGGVADSGLYWGTGTAAYYLHCDGQDFEMPGAVSNAHRGPGGQLIANLQSDKGTMVYKNGKWQPGAFYGNATDIASDGAAIGGTQDGKAAPILLGSKWSGIERTAPDIPAAWKDSSVMLTDTTPGGWILARRGASGAYENAVKLPIRVEGVAPNSDAPEATAVDAYSIGCPDPGIAVNDRIWIMAPSKAGSSDIIIKAPLNANTPLKLSASGIKFGNEDSITLGQAANTVSIKASDSTTSGVDIPIKLELGPGQSLSQPIGVKIMKARNVKVTIHPVVSIVPGKNPNGPDLVSTKPVVEAHLNKIYGPQINVNFVVTVMPPQELAWDTATSSDFPGTDPSNFVSSGNGYLDFMGDEARTEENVIDNTLRDEEANINIYILGRGALNPMLNWDGVLRRPSPWGACAFARDERNMIFIDGDIGWFNTLANRDSATERLHTIAHEIGHCIVGKGHPNEGGGQAPLKGLLPANAVAERLMTSGDKVRRPNFGCRLVKGEWDEAEKWMKAEEQKGKM